LGHGVGSFDVGGGVNTKLVGVDIEGFDVVGRYVVGFSVGNMVRLLVGCDGSAVCCCFVGALVKLVGCGVGAFDVGGGVNTKLVGVDVEGFDVVG
jgi:hypothetical protein